MECEHGIEGEPCPDCIKDYHAERAEENSVLSDGVRCVGIDNKQHTCDPTKDVTSCGISIRRKKFLPNNYKLYSCYECTY